MPFVSEAQRRLFYARPDLHKYIPEYEAATGHRKLPERVGKLAKAIRKRHKKHHRH